MSDNLFMVTAQGDNDTQNSPKLNIVFFLTAFKDKMMSLRLKEVHCSYTLKDYQVTEMSYNSFSKVLDCIRLSFMNLIRVL